MKSTGWLWTILMLTGSAAMATTYMVDINHPQASDDNPGTPDLPWRTIGKAVTVVETGDTVIVKGGTYRETVRMQRGDTPPKPITFVAKPIGEVVVKGSDVVTDWERAEGSIWRKRDWELAGKLGRETARNFVFRREQVFCDGRPLRHVERKDQIQRGTFPMDVEGKALYVWLPGGGNPNERTMEVSSRPVLWYGNELTPYVRLRGFRFEHCPNRAQRGGIHLDSAHGWVLEDCTVEWTNGTGMKLNDSARITVRRCRFNNNGQLGIGKGAIGMRVIATHNHV